MNRARKGALLSAAVSSIACMGDTILYSVLPVYADTLAISDLWIGFFLSINRFVRLFSHGLVAILILRVGLKHIVLVSSILSCVCTFFYQFPTQLSLFAISRISWGIAYSGLRQSMLMYASKVEFKRKESFAISQFVKSLGPLLILFLGPILFNQWEYQKSYQLIFLVTLAAVLVALMLPDLPVLRERFSYSNVLRLSSFKVLLFIIAFIADGFLVVTLALTFQSRYQEQASLLIAVSLFLLFKRLISTLLPLLFLKSYKFVSIGGHLVIGMILILLGLVMLYQQILYVGLILCFIGNSLFETNAPIEELEHNLESTKMEAVTSVTFWWDMGKAFGALLGIKLYKFLGSEMALVVLGISFFLAALKFCKHDTQARAKALF